MLVTSSLKEGNVTGDGLSCTTEDACPSNTSAFILRSPVSVSAVAFRFLSEIVLSFLSFLTHHNLIIS